MSMIVFLFNGDTAITDILNVNQWVDLLSKLKNSFSLESSFLIIVPSYIIGHVISYISSVFVEDFSNKVYGYPSKYLLEEDRYVYKDLWKRYFRTEAKSENKYMRRIKILLRFFLKIVVFLLLTPISMPVYTFGYLLDINHFITRPLDARMKRIIKDKILSLYRHLQIKGGEDVEDFHRIVMHYANINVSNSHSKVNNYIALYGFLRCMSFLSCLFFDVVLYKILWSIDVSAPIDWLAIVMMIIAFTIAYVFFLAFIKFYRRTTLEDFMTLVVDSGILEEKRGLLDVFKAKIGL